MYNFFQNYLTDVIDHSIISDVNMSSFWIFGTLHLTKDMSFSRFILN